MVLFLFFFSFLFFFYPTFGFAWGKGRKRWGRENRWGDIVLTICPLVDRVGAVPRQRRVQFFPQYIELVLQIDKEHIGVARGPPRVTAHARVAVVPVEDLLLGPFVRAVGPAHGVERGRILPVPQVDADGLVGAVGRRRRLSGDWGVAVGGVAVEAAVPAGLEADVGVVHGL